MSSTAAAALLFASFDAANRSDSCKVEVEHFWCHKCSVMHWRVYSPRNMDPTSPCMACGTKNARVRSMFKLAELMERAS
jgi:hypothetical protein